MIGRLSRCFLILFVTTLAVGQKTEPRCSNCAVWNTPQKPFRIYGNTFYVGTHGLSSILIETGAGLVLIDGALPESAALIAANIRTLGFRMEDVKTILNTHAHFDHAGGIAELQRMTGAEVIVSPWSAELMKKGGVSENDPQYGDLLPIAPVARVRALRDGESLKIGATVLIPHATPGHTPGGTSWTWESCEAKKCLAMVYADSISPISADGFKYTSSSKYPNAMQDFERSFAFLDSTRCDVLMTPHPEVSGLWDHLAARNRGVTPDPLVDSGACKRLAGVGRDVLKKRVAAESGQ